MAILPVPSGGSLPEGERPDAELIECVRVGDPDAFDALVTRHMRRAYALAFRLLSHREDAEDLVQEAFLTVLEKIDSFEAGRDFVPWFNRILVNRGLNSRKARAIRRTDAIPDAAVSPVLSPSREAEQAQIGERVREAVASLPERQRIVIELFELEGYSGVEIAEMLDISPGTVRWHLHEARRALRDALAPLERKD